MSAKREHFCFEVPGVQQTGSYWAKYRWIAGFDSTDDEMVWTVELSEDTTFNVRVGNGMDLLEPGTITIPAGRHELR